MSLVTSMGYFVIDVEWMRREKMTRKRERVKRPAAASVLPLGVC
jgi:hypothetical protein